MRRGPYRGLTPLPSGPITVGALFPVRPALDAGVVARRAGATFAFHQRVRGSDATAYSPPSLQADGCSFVRMQRSPRWVREQPPAACGSPGYLRRRNALLAGAHESCFGCLSLKNQRGREVCRQAAGVISSRPSGRRHAASRRRLDSFQAMYHHAVRSIKRRVVRLAARDDFKRAKQVLGGLEVFLRTSALKCHLHIIVQRG